MTHHMGFQDLASGDFFDALVLPDSCTLRKGLKHGAICSLTLHSTPSDGLPAMIEQRSRSFFRTQQQADSEPKIEISKPGDLILKPNTTQIASQSLFVVEAALQYTVARLLRCK